MAEIVAFPADSPVRRGLRIGAAVLALLLSACSPEYDWRDIPAPGGGYQVHLPAKPATMTRRIHLESLEVEMTMQGAQVKGNSFTVADVPLPAPGSSTPGDAGPGQAAGMSPQRILLAMREQMLRNIGAPPSMPARDVDISLIDADGTKVGATPAQAVVARGTGKHADLEMHARFVLWQGHALQIVAVGPDLDPEQAGHFLESLRLVKR
jgi:hypothetical protein